jgi:hypothetical protein
MLENRKRWTASMANVPPTPPATIRHLIGKTVARLPATEASSTNRHREKKP